MEILEIEPEEVVRLNLWVLRKVLQTDPSPLYRKHGNAVFEPLDVRFYRVREGGSRLYLRESDIPLVLSFLRLRDSGIRHPRVLGFHFRWSDFICLVENAQKRDIPVEELVGVILSDWCRSCCLNHTDIAAVHEPSL
jgi:hypothetical protein